MLVDDDRFDVPGSARTTRRSWVRGVRIAWSTGGLLLVALATGSLAVARQPGALRLLILAAVTLLIVGVDRVTPWPGRPRQRRPPPSSRRSRAMALVGALVFVALLVRLGWWGGLFVIPGVALAAVMHRVGPAERWSARPRRRTALVAGVVVLVIASPWIWSVETTMAAADSDSLSVRGVEWIRDHGGAGIVDDIEHWWYTRHQPPVGGKPTELGRQHRGGPTSAPTLTNSSPLPRVPTPAAAPLGNEGVWTVTAGTTTKPAVATTLVRPDAIHTSLVVGIMSIDPREVRLELLSGTEQPGGLSRNGATVPPADRPNLLAAFNAGFRMTESRGGWYSDGHTVVPLQNGAASLVLRDDGRADVGVWGRDDVMGPHVVAVRQNLALIVDGGRPVVGIDDSANMLWGRTVGHKVLVPRSGIGITAAGRLVYVGGPGLSVQTLANTLMAAGAVRAMELDINTDWVAAYTFRASATGPVGTKLVDAMRDPPSHYLSIGTRDFIAVLAKPAA